MCFIIEICMHPFKLNIVVCSQMTAGVILSAVNFASPSILLGQLGLVHNTELWTDSGTTIGGGLDWIDLSSLKSDY